MNFELKTKLLNSSNFLTNMLPKNVFYARMAMTLLIIIFSVLTVLNHKSALKIITELKEKAKAREKEERFRFYFNL